MRQTIITAIMLSVTMFFTVYTNGQTSVKIGKQEWTTKNLDVSTYRNGDPIPQVKDPFEWETLTTGAWCYFANNTGNGKIYGKLYNWYAVNDPRGLAPKGWHIATDAEWIILTSYLDEPLADGIGPAGKMKVTGTTLWQSPNEYATNSSGWSGLPGGCRSGDGEFADMGVSGCWWTASESDETSVWSYSISNNSSGVDRLDLMKNFGFSVRCVKDYL